MDTGHCLVCGGLVPPGKKACDKCIMRLREGKKRKSRAPTALAVVACLALAAWLFSPQGMVSGDKAVKYPYVLDGQDGLLEIMVSGSFRDRLSGTPRNTLGGGSDIDLEKRYLTDKGQAIYLEGIVRAIRLKSNDPDTQARIAISMVQNIPYDQKKFGNIEGAVERYPYEVLYDGRGLCGEKSKLLSLMLAELGYGTALFHWPGVHQAAGVSCPKEQSHMGSGYCFIETVAPTVPTHQPGTYWIYGGSLPGDPILINVADGRELDLEAEYHDGRLVARVEGKRQLTEGEYYPYMRIAKRYGLRFDG